MEVMTWVWIGLGVWAVIFVIAFLVHVFVLKDRVTISDKKEEYLHKIETNKRAGGALHTLSGDVAEEAQDIALYEDEGDEKFHRMMKALDKKTVVADMSHLEPPSPSSPKPSSPASPPAKTLKPTYQPPKQAVVTEKTRSDIDQMITGIRSLAQEMDVNHLKDLDDDDPEIQKLRESDIVVKLAETLVSDVKTEVDEVGKYSKMSLDASLFFDEEDVDFFEKEFEWDPEDEESITDKQLYEEVTQEDGIQQEEGPRE